MDAPSVHGDEQQSAATRCVAATPSTYSLAEGAPDLALSSGGTAARELRSLQTCNVEEQFGDQN
uniref:Uncharacterized protein n=1 Tax=Oryza meridionalis TaxID=40149 RepID=A0A0E0C1X0_9ORYZ